VRTLLICHQNNRLDVEIMPRWLASFSTLAGVVSIADTPGSLWRRTRRELRRVGPVRLLDVMAFRLYYATTLAGADRRWEDAQLRELATRYAPVNGAVARMETASPNTKAVEDFIRQAAPDIVIARCKFLLKESVFSIATRGTFVIHPGICPEYRNAHGCFWALAERDTERVGATLLRIDRGIDTGPVFGYFRAPIDETRESHIRIQSRVVYDNLDAIAGTLRAVHDGTATPLETNGRPSAVWGQPWLTKHLRWKRLARRSAA
jgi:folate-dependent phosphoribosylglycinamide formyltransferase PurN